MAAEQTTSRRRIQNPPPAAPDPNAFPLVTAFQARPSQTRLFYRGRSDAPAGYYRPSQVGTYDSDTISTMGWYMDPYFMMTHPWYWGTNDQEFRSTMLMMELMSHQGERSSRPEAFFADQTPYDPAQFRQPIEPRLRSDDAVPFTDAWNSPALRSDTSAADLLGWDAASGTGAGTKSVDYTPDYSGSSESSSSGWSTPTRTPDEDTSTSSTTGSYDMTTTTTTTTGSDWTTPTATTTTTGTDWTTTTTTTGSDYTTTTTTTGSDWTTTGSDSTTTGSDSTTTGSDSTTGGGDW